MYKKEDALYATNILGINFDKFTLEEFLIGLNIESEHGRVNPITNITDNDLIKTSKIAIAHLSEFPNYYNPNYGLKAFEEFLKNKLKSL